MGNLENKNLISISICALIDLKHIFLDIVKLIFVYGPIKVQRTREWLKKDCYNVQNNKGELVLLFQIKKNVTFHYFITRISHNKYNVKI
jgi:hypothetical protein